MASIGFGAPQYVQYFTCPETDGVLTGAAACIGTAGACILKYAIAKSTQATSCTKPPIVRRASRVLSDTET